MTAGVALRVFTGADVAAVAAIEAEVNPSPWPASLFAGELDLDPDTRDWLVAVGPEPPGAAGADPAGEGRGYGSPGGAGGVAPGGDGGEPWGVVGFGGVTYLADVAHVLDVAVAPSHRRRGIGRALCLALGAAAHGHGLDALTLEVRAANHGAIALYTGLGMTEVGRRPRYYPDGEDAVLFTASDLGTWATAAPLVHG
ncbi:MAG: GNAT family N-acetyltransferase [Acidimicrobiales bacterium]